MATVTISMPDPMRDLIERQVREGSYSDVSEYLLDLVRQDLQRVEGPSLSVDDLRKLVEDARAEGLSEDTFEDVRRAARAAALARLTTHG